jgi:L-malate glycosyltransferase
MGVLFLTFWYPSKENPYQGIFIKNHAAAIHKSGVKIQVLAVDIQPSKYIFQKTIEHFKDENGVDTHYIHIHSKLHKWIYSIPFLLNKIVSKYIKKNIPTEEVNILHSNVLFPCGVVANSLLKTYHWKHVHTEHWSKMDQFIQKHPFGYLGRKTLKEADKISVVSNFLKEKAEPFIQNTSKISVIPNVIDTSIFHWTEQTLPNSKIVFTAVATWKSPKCPIFFVKALNEIQQKSTVSLELNLIGEGPLLQEIKALPSSIKINYLGRKNKQEIATILQQSNYFLHASTIETFSVVIAEALCSGVPVIASQVGAIPELISPENGITARNNVEDWVKAIENGMQKKYDQKAIASNCAQKYKETKIGELFLEFYRF